MARGEWSLGSSERPISSPVAISTASGNGSEKKGESEAQQLRELSVKGERALDRNETTLGPLQPPHSLS